MSSGTFKHWDRHLAKNMWLVYTRGSTNPIKTQSKPLMTVEMEKIPVAQVKIMLRKTVWVILASGKGKPLHRIALAQESGYVLGG